MVNTTPNSPATASPQLSPEDRERLRVAKLRDALKDLGVTGRALAKEMGVTAPQVSRVLSSPKALERYVDALRGHGVPEDLLPEITDGRPGPRPGWLDDLKARAALAPSAA